MTPRLSSILYAARRASSVWTLASGEFAPSTVRKIGSSPSVLLKRICTSAGVIDQPESGTWHETHDRPLVPRLLKKGLFSSSGPPSIVTVRRTPAALGASITPRRGPP